MKALPAVAMCAMVLLVAACGGKEHPRNPWPRRLSRRPPSCRRSTS